MFKVRPFIIFTINILLLALSWFFYKFPQGDEYLVLFVIPLIFLLVPYSLTLRSSIVLFLLNITFFLYYYYLKALNPVDIVVLAALLISVSAISFIVKKLSEVFEVHQGKELSAIQVEYNGILDKLEDVDRKGHSTEKDLVRISRLYEVTKQLAPVLKFNDMLDALFSFLEDNFKLQVAHLLTFSKGTFSHGVSKSIAEEDYYTDPDRVLEYEEVVDYLRDEQDNKAFFMERSDSESLFESLKIQSDTFQVFPLFVGDKLAAVLAIEGALKSSYSGFRILIPQIALELRKVDLYEQVQQLSIIDGLTETYLRRYLMGRLEEEVDRAQRLGMKFSVGMVDVDHFKKCNDKYGHLVGDTVLKTIAGRLKKSVREVDMISRYGGEEFCIVLPETAKKSALVVAERIRTSVESKEIVAFDEKIKTTVSVGIATYPEDGEDVNTLLENADSALYKAKRKGRNRVCS